MNYYRLFSTVMTVFSITIFVIVWIYSMGVFIDSNNNSLKIVTGFSKKDIKVLLLSAINSIDVELIRNYGMNFIVYYKNGFAEKIEYKFYRISIVEELQYKRLKKQLNRVKYS